MKDCQYKIGDKVLFQGREYEVRDILPAWFWGFDLYLGGRGWEHMKLVTPLNKGKQMTNKQEAKQQLEKLEAEVQKLKEIINKPEKVGSLLEDGAYYIIPGNNGSAFQSFFSASYKYGNNSFKDGQVAQAYAEAFNTMLALRKCDGSEVANNISAHYSIELSTSTTNLIVGGWTGVSGKLSQISPVFSSKEYAQAAIDKVGKDNIIKMFKTLHGIYD